MSPILVALTSRSDSDFERSNISLKENKRYGVDSNSDGFDYCVRKNEGKFYGFRQTVIVISPDGQENSELARTILIYLQRADV